MYPLSKSELMNYLKQALDKINTNTSIDDLNRLKHAVNNPSFGWNADDKVILHEAIDKRLNELKK